MHEDSFKFLTSVAEDPDTSKEISVDQMEALKHKYVAMLRELFDQGIRFRWAAIEPAIQAALQSLDAGLSSLKLWDEYATEVENWLDQVTDFVHNEQPAVGDLPTLKAQLEQSEVRSAVFLLILSTFVRCFAVVLTFSKRC